jgi:hypothetical protein
MDNDQKPSDSECYTPRPVRRADNLTAIYEPIV